MLGKINNNPQDTQQRFFILIAGTGLSNTGKEQNTLAFFFGSVLLNDLQYTFTCQEENHTRRKAQVRHRWEQKSSHNISAKSVRNYMLMLKQYQIIYPQVFKQSISIEHLKL